MEHIETYRKRPVRCEGVWEADGWRLKLYGIAYRGDGPRPEVVAAANEVARSALPQPPATADRYGVGFLIIHDGRAGCWCLLDWWGNEDILFHRLFAAPSERPREFKPVTNEVTACVWEIAVWNFERQAWVDTILANPAGPNLDCYLEVQLNADV